MSRCVLVLAALFSFFLKSVSVAGESSDNRAGKTWSFEGTTGYRAQYVREYSLGVTRLDNLSPARGGTSLVLSRLWTNRAYYGSRGTWKLKGHSLSGGYRKFLGNSFFVEGSLVAEIFRAWADAYAEYEAAYEAEEFGHGQRWVATVQIGNQWQWEHVNFAITWLGHMLPLSHKVDKRGRNTDFHRYLDDPSNLGLRFSLGWAI